MIPQVISCGIRIGEVGNVGILSAVGDDLQPVSVRVGDEIDPHFRVFKADAAHFLMETVGSLIIVRNESQMELAVTEIVRAVHIAQPGELQLKPGSVISDKNNDEGTVFGGDAPFFGQTERLFVEIQ